MYAHRLQVNLLNSDFCLKKLNFLNSCKEEFLATTWNVKFKFTFIYKGTLKYLNRPKIILFQAC